MAPRRRNYGTGTVSERSPRVWRVRVDAGLDPVTGARRRISETVHGSQKDANRRLAELTAQHSGKPGATSATLRLLVDRWLDVAKIEKSTIANYRRALKHLPDTMLDMPLAKLDAHDLDSLYASLGRQGVGAPTVRTIHAALSSAFSQAVKWRWLPANPAASASPPRPNRSRATAPTIGTIRDLLTACESDQSKLWLRLMVITGARRSEVLALRWVNLDGDRLTLGASLTIYRELKITKTGETRALTLDPETVAELERWRVKAKARALSVGARLSKSAFILSDEPDSAQPWRPDRATKRFAQICKRAGIDGVRLHDLRHANASLLLAQGIDLRTVSDRLGHGRTSTTLDVYSHVVPTADVAAATILASILDDGKRKVNDQ